MKAEIIFCDGKTTSSRCGIIPVTWQFFVGEEMDV